MNYSENLINLTIFNVAGKMFADAYAKEVENARANGTNPIEWIQDLIEEEVEDFKLTDKEAFAYKVKEVINYFTNEEITKEEVQEYLN